MNNDQTDKHREIICRGKRIDNGEWVAGWLLGDKQTFIVSNFITDSSVRGDMKCPNLAISDIHEVDPKTIGQFIGLKDKKGDDIYEGDILLMPVTEREFVKVVFVNGRFQLEAIEGNKFINTRLINQDNFNDHSEVYEIVGKIYKK